MKMVQCPKGHFYDSEKNDNCPYCTGQSANSIGKTVGYADGAFQPSGGSSVGKTVGLESSPSYDDYEIGKTVALDGSSDSYDDYDDAGKTVAIFQKKLDTKIDPVVGWLVCISGSEMGKDYKLHADNNFIGRSKKMDVCIESDETISRENHAVIGYDSKYKKFYFAPGEGRAIVRINEQSVFSTIELKDYDIIEIGDTRLIFMGLCGENFSW